MYGHQQLHTIQLKVRMPLLPTGRLYRAFSTRLRYHENLIVVGTHLLRAVTMSTKPIKTRNKPALNTDADTPGTRHQALLNTNRRIGAFA